MEVGDQLITVGGSPGHYGTAQVSWVLYRGGRKSVKCSGVRWNVQVYIGVCMCMVECEGVRRSVQLYGGVCSCTLQFACVRWSVHV